MLREGQEEVHGTVFLCDSPFVRSGAEQQTPELLLSQTRRRVMGGRLQRAEERGSRRPAGPSGHPAALTLVREKREEEGLGLWHSRATGGPQIKIPSGERCCTRRHGAGCASLRAPSLAEDSLGFVPWWVFSGSRWRLPPAPFS